MSPRCKRAAGLMLVVMPASSCTFGMLKADECLELYGPGMIEAVAQAGSSGAVTEESYGYCVDGRSRARAMLAPLQAHGFRTEGPIKHFEVPGGWCLSAIRPTTPERFEPVRSLQDVCAIGHASRAYLTGGTISTADGKTHYLRSTYDREDQERLERRHSK